MTAPRIALVIMAALALMLPSLPAVAQDVGGVIREMDGLIQQKNSIEARLEANLSLKRQSEIQYQSMEQESAQMEVESRQIDAETARLSSEINGYNSYCSGTFDEAEYAVRSAWCSSNGPILEGQSANLQGRIDNFNAWVYDYNTRYEAIDRQEDQRVAEAEALFQEYENINMRLQALEEILRLSTFAQDNQNCANLPNLEDMHHCMQTIWDGAR